MSAAIFVFTTSVISTKKAASDLGISGPDSETHAVPPAIESFIVSTRESWFQLKPANVQLVLHPAPPDTSIFLPLRSAVLLNMVEFVCPPHVCSLRDV